MFGNRSRHFAKQEYCGDTVNFRSTTKSFKNKKKIERPPEEWQIFKDTRPAIIEREGFALVQELRKHRRRPIKSGIVSPFLGLLYCTDCGEKLFDERYATLSMFYEEERRTLKAAVPEIQVYLENETDKTESLQRFIQKVKQIEELKALTPELIHEFVDKIVVYAPRYLDGKWVQLLDIYYSGVGILHELPKKKWKKRSSSTFRSATKRKWCNQKGHTVFKGLFN